MRASLSRGEEISSSVSPRPSGTDVLRTDDFREADDKTSDTKTSLLMISIDDEIARETLHGLCTALSVAWGAVCGSAPDV
ncbi:hypothetical protein E4U33_005620 [Claviceps sp. LM78 group G4]|nr:hypothetical protein E4U33_005620 [Claviceps sp. LM78 group G4]